MARKTYEELQREIDQLKEQVKVNEAVSQVSLGDTLLQEAQKLGAQTQVTAGGIPVKVIDDHKNVKLYTEFNKVIEVHPANARQTMERFYSKGVPLYAQKRTPEQIEAYKRSEVGKRRAEERHKEYERKKANSRQGRINELAKIVAMETGKAVSNVVLPKKD